MKDSTFLDEDKEKVNTRKIKITEALVDAETGKRKIILKKKKKKGGKKTMTEDMNMLSVGVENDGNDSWDSSRGTAQHVDLSHQAPNNTSGIDSSMHSPMKTSNYSPP